MSSIKIKNENENYAAQVVSIHNLIDLENADSLLGFPINGMMAIVAKGHYDIGDVGIIFPAESQLSVEICKNNNLFRDSTLNKDTTVSGYLENTRRVKALKLRGHLSTALFLPLKALDYLGIDTSNLKIGDTFTHINGAEICRKYEIKVRGASLGNKTKGKTKTFKRIDNKTFPEHWDTDKYFMNQDKYKPFDTVIITQKLHGTSARFTNQKVRKKLSRLERVLKWFGVNVKDYEYDTLAGSRRVIKDIKANDGHDHYYDVDIWNAWLEKVKHVIPKNWVLYGEIIGYTDDCKEIQKNYTYNCEVGTSDLYIYRITIVNEDGVVCDLSWDAIKEFCHQNGLKHVPELYVGTMSQIDIEDGMDKSYHDEGFAEAIPVSKNSPCDEGVCVRREGLTPYVTKAKSPKFLLHETRQLDKGVVDMESQETVDSSEPEDN